MNVRKLFTFYFCVLIVAMNVACSKGDASKGGPPGGAGGGMPVKTETVQAKPVPNYTE